MTPSLEQLEAAERVCLFPRHSVESLILTLIEGVMIDETLADKYERQGKLGLASDHRKRAEKKQQEIEWWEARI